MKIVSWNCQGVGDDEFRRKFRELVRVHRLDVVFLLETRVAQEQAYNIAPFLGFSRYHLAPTDGMDGGIWLLWNEENIDVDILEFDDQYIHALVGPK